MSIDNFSAVSTVTAADKLAMYSATLGSNGAVTLATLLAWLQTQLTSSGALVSQYAAPAATGFSVQILPTNNGTSVLLILTPVAGYAAGTVILPPQVQCVDGQQVYVTTTQAVAAFTVNGNGAIAVNGAPTTLTAGGFFRLRYDGPSKSWFRVG